MDTHLEELTSLLGQIADLSHAAHVLEWDQETYMPEGAARARAQQLATLRRVAHEHLTSSRIQNLLDVLEPYADGLDPDAKEYRLIHESRRDVERAVKLPSSLVGALAEAVSEAQQGWKQARSEDAFGLFAPHLERVLDLVRQKANALATGQTVYDTLLDTFEPGMTATQVASVFQPLRETLVPWIEQIRSQPVPDDACLRQPIDEKLQWAFSRQIAEDIGFDMHRGRLDRSAHPFTTAFGMHDVRITTRVDPQFFPTAFFGTLHEVGHGLYEQNIASDLARTPLGEAASLAIHESQSRLWENLIGRSRPFWKHYFPKLQRQIQDPFARVTLSSFYQAINIVAPSAIRVEADEVTYPLHVMLRFDLEQRLFANTLSVADLPEAWRAGMQAYLGLAPDTDRDGVLQDIHWSLGAFGYFPTYALGTLMASQFWAALKEQVGDVDRKLAAGQTEDILDWLRAQVHRHGRMRTADEILRTATGETLTPTYWLDYISTKYQELYPGSELNQL